MNSVEPRLCFVGHAPSLEGAGRYLIDQATYLIDHGVRVFAILPWDGPLASRLSTLGAEVRFASNPWWTRSRWVLTDESLAATASAARVMADILDRWKIDVVYTQTIVAPAGAIAAALANRPHIWHVHEYAYNPDAIEMAIPKAMLAALMDATSNSIFFNSRSVESEWIDLLPRAKMNVVYNWVRASSSSEPSSAQPDVSIPEGAFVVAIVGSVQRWKRQLDAVQAVHSLLTRGADVHLLVIGPFVEPDYAAEIQAYVASNQLGDRVHVLGFVEDPTRLVSRAQVSVVCSDREPFGRVTIDSMALGVPVVATNSGGTPEIIEHGVTGLLFDVGDVGALATALDRLRHVDLRARMGAAAKLRAADFSNPDAAMEPVVRVIRSLVGKANPAWPLGSILSPGIPTPLTGDARGLSGHARRFASMIRRLLPGGSAARPGTRA